MCSSSKSLSMSGLPSAPGVDPDGTWEHTFERIKIRGCILRDSPLNLFRECFGVVEGSLDLGLWPLEMLGNCGHILFISTEEQHHFPYCERAALDVCLSADGRVAKINERELRPPETFF